jgi:hypothetical protein
LANEFVGNGLARSVDFRQEQGLRFAPVGDKRLPPAIIAPALHCTNWLSDKNDCFFTDNHQN